MLPHRVQRANGPAVVQAEPGHDPETLRLDEDAPLVVLPAAHLPALVVVCPEEPIPVPAVAVHGRAHLR